MDVATEKLTFTQSGYMEETISLATYLTGSEEEGDTLSLGTAVLVRSYGVVSSLSETNWAQADGVYNYADARLTIEGGMLRARSFGNCWSHTVVNEGTVSVNVMALAVFSGTSTVAGGYFKALGIPGRQNSIQLPRARERQPRRERLYNKGGYNFETERTWRACAVANTAGKL